jgi:hypothetical protein
MPVGEESLLHTYAHSTEMHRCVSCIWLFFFPHVRFPKSGCHNWDYEESQDGHLGKAGITRNNTSTKERVILGHAFHWSSKHISNLTVNNAGYLGVKPEELAVWQNMHHPSRPEGMNADEKPYQCNQYGTYFVQKSHLTKHEKVHTGKSPVSVARWYICLEVKTHSLGLR